MDAVFVHNNGVAKLGKLGLSSKNAHELGVEAPMRKYIRARVSRAPAEDNLEDKEHSETRTQTPPNPRPSARPPLSQWCGGLGCAAAAEGRRSTVGGSAPASGYARKGLPDSAGAREPGPPVAVL